MKSIVMTFLSIVHIASVGPRSLLLAKFPMPELELVVATACGVLVETKTVRFEGCRRGFYTWEGGDVYICPLPIVALLGYAPQEAL